MPCSLYIDLRAIFAYVAAVELVYTRRNYITANSSLIGLSLLLLHNRKDLLIGLIFDSDIDSIIASLNRS